MPSDRSDKSDWSEGKVQGINGALMQQFLKNIKEFIPTRCHHRVLLVGGIVRDHLLGRLGHDLDLLSDLSHDELLQFGFRLVEAKSSAPIYFRYHSELGKIEIVRIDTLKDMAVDLARRDFTINAMAMTLSGELLDPLGGARDLREGVLRPCSENVFLDDPLRVFRAFRFECDGWRMTAGAEKLVRAMEWSRLLENLPPERFSAEMIKALAAADPGRFFQRMLEFTVGEGLLPELFRLPEVPAGPVEYHPEGDLFTHSLQVLQRVLPLSGDPLARFCAFFHDLGKLATPPESYPKHHGHDDAGFELAAGFCNRLALSAIFRKALAWVCRLHGKANNWEQLRDSTRLKMAEQALKGGIVTILPLVAMADKADTPPMRFWGQVVHVVRMSTAQLGIEPERLMAMPTVQRGAFILQRRVERLRELYSLSPLPLPLSAN